MYCSTCDEHLGDEQKICPMCEEDAEDYGNYCDRMHDRYIDYFPVTVQKQYQKAWEQKQELKRR